MQKKKHNVSVIVPAYNEADSIERVLKKVGPQYELIVVDDGSVDRTADIARKYATKVVEYKNNRGKGYALRQGASNSQGGILVFLDGDGQHDPLEIPKLIAPIIAGDADAVIGVRESEKIKRISAFRWLTNSLSVMAVQAICGRRYCDVLSGFRAIKRSVFLGVDLHEDGFQAELEFLVRAPSQGVRVSEIPISARTVRRPSRLGLRAGTALVWYLCREVANAKLLKQNNAERKIHILAFFFI